MINPQQAPLRKLYAGPDITLYQSVAEKGFEVLLASAPEMIEIYNRPECVGTAFQQKLSSVVSRALAIIQERSNTELSQVLRTSPMDVLYLLRGGLNFNLHRNLAEVVGRLPEVTFLSSQRIEADQGFEIAESAYQKWSIQDRSVFCIGDISATGTTIRHALDSALARYDSEGKTPKRLFVVTIGTLALVDELLSDRKRLIDAWGPIFEGISILFLEAAFHLYKGDSSLSNTHLAYTDFFRKGAPRTPEFELQSLINPICFLERCAIYDGGSRAFEPNLYLRNLNTYWDRLLRANAPDLQQLFELKTDILDYQLSFHEWRQTKPWWSGVPDQTLKELHDLGGSAVGSMLSRSLKEICEERLTQLVILKEESE